MVALVRFLRRHWVIALVLVLATAVRAGVAIAYWPAIFFGDSWAYIDLAYDGTPVGIAPDRPSGYPLLIDLLSLAGRSLAVITTAQHLAGLAVGVLSYAVLVRLGISRWLAAAAAGIVLLDGYAIALEQQILAESFFTLALAGSAFLAIGRDRGPAALAASGLLLAGATTIRAVAVFAVPVWLLYVLWAHGRTRVSLVAALAVTLPLLGYSAVHAANTGRFGLTQADGWFLYGRVGKFADCGDADIPTAGRPLCNRNARDRREGAAFHIWNADGPARRVFGGITRESDRQERSNRILRQFALAIIRDRPGQYAEVVASDFLKYFRTGVMSNGNSDLALNLPEHGRLVRRNERIRDRYFPDYEPRVREPAALMRDYQTRIHTPRWLMGVLAAGALIALLLAALIRGGLLPGGAPRMLDRRDGRPELLARRRETFLLVGMALAMLLATAATSEFVLRYLIPAVPLLVCGGTAAWVDLALAVRERVALGAGRLTPGRGRRGRGSPHPESSSPRGPARARSRLAEARARAGRPVRRPRQAPRGPRGRRAPRVLQAPAP